MSEEMDRELAELVAGTVVEDRDAGSFKVHRRAFVDERITELERRRIFDKCWLYLGHVSEVRKPGSFVSRNVAGRPLIFNRDRDGKLHAFYNTCSHRGAQVCRERQGKRRNFQCPYHGWVYDDRGVLIDMPGKEAVAPELISSGSMNLREVPRLAEYMGFVFVAYDPDICSLEQFLGDAKDILELTAQHGGADGMEIVGGTQQYSINANWKLLGENSADSYHGIPTHSTYFDYLINRDSLPPFNQEDLEMNVKDLGNGHAVLETRDVVYGRPVAKWAPGWGEEAREEVDAIRDKLVADIGEERAMRIAKGQRNAVLFPNLVINDVMALTVRTYYPDSAGMMRCTSWALAPVGESASSRERRLRNFVEFLGPAGFATPDDVEMLESCQRGYRAIDAVEWNDISRGMRDDLPKTDTEKQMRAFWRKWSTMLGGDSSHTDLGDSAFEADRIAAE